MIQIKFDPKKLTGDKRRTWDEWIAKADAATQEVIKEWIDWKQRWHAWEQQYRATKDPALAKLEPQFEPQFKEDVWKGFRDWLLENVFNNKCAYCETYITRAIPDTEHFRPKKQVRDKVSGSDRSVIVKIKDEDGNELPHPGYFWLAYNWKNLLPSCHFCNRYEGKKDQFPALQHVAVTRLTADQIKKLSYQIIKQDGTEDIFYLEPEDLDAREQRKLLHPYFDDPTEHLVFGMDGKVIAKQGSAMASETIRVFNLDDPDITAMRATQQSNADREYLVALAAVKDLQSKQKAAKEVLREYVQGKYPYAAAVISYLHTEFGGSPLDPEKLIAEGFE